MWLMMLWLHAGEVRTPPGDDVDGDGYASVLVGGLDCDDRRAWVRPDAWDGRGDGVDADCEGADGMRDISMSAQVWRGFTTLRGVVRWWQSPKTTLPEGPV